MGDCYSVTVSDPAVRPVQHWDALLQETLNLSLPHSWVLHIGESFADVPTRSSFTGSSRTSSTTESPPAAAAALLPGQPGDPRADGRLPAEVQARPGIHSSALHRHLYTDVPCTGLFAPGSRSSRPRRHHRRMRRRELLPRQHRHAAADGGLPPQGPPRPHVRPPGLHGPLRRMWRARASSPTGSSSSPTEGSRADAPAPALIAQPTRTTAARWRCFWSRHSDWFFMAGSSDWDHLSYRRPAGGLPPDFVRRYLLLGVCRWWSARSRSIWRVAATGMN